MKGKLIKDTQHGVQKSVFFNEKLLNFIVLIIGIAGFAFITNAMAKTENKKILSKKNQWTILSGVVNEKKICYAINYSFQSSGNTVFEKANKPYLDIDYLGKDDFKFSIHFPKKLETNSIVFLSVDERQFELKSYEDFAYFEKYEDDAEIIDLLENAQKVISRATYFDQTYSVETFDPTRFNQSKDTMLSSCKKTIK